MDAGSIKRSDFNDYKTIEEVVSTLQYQVRTRPITEHMNLHTDVSMDSYPGPSGQRIVNFFTNALAHAFPADTKGNIWISCTRHGDDTLRIEFKHDGCGIPDANIGRVFEPFFTTRMGQGGQWFGPEHRVQYCNRHARRDPGVGQRARAGHYVYRAATTRGADFGRR